ncbi:MAG: CBS domain-containing protein [Rhodospirillales bacterium]|nr:CBS domain-containing protein [Rhodospirillales bacterium]MCB9995373.1 CBS domain-containing protein [Rhodospirillales bacterium]
MKTITAQMPETGDVQTVRDIVNQRPCLTFYPKERVSDIVREMHGHHSGAAGVIDADGRFIGLVTEREILRRLFKMIPETEEQIRFADDDKPIMGLTAWDVMIATPDRLPADMPVEEALEVITQAGYRYMPVMEGKNSQTLAGIIGERELFLYAQGLINRKLAAKDTLLSYLMHHEPYGCGAVV